MKWWVRVLYWNFRSKQGGADRGDGRDNGWGVKTETKTYRVAYRIDNEMKKNRMKTEEKGRKDRRRYS